LKQTLNNKISYVESLLESCADGTYKTKVQNTLTEARNLYQGSQSSSEINDMIATLNQYISEMENSFWINSVSGSNVKSWSERENRLYVYGEAADMGDIAVTVARDDDEEAATMPAVYQAVQGEAYAGTVTAANDETGITYVWYVYYKFDYSVFEILNVQGDNILYYNLSQVDDDADLYLYGTTASIPDFTISVNNGVTYEIVNDEDEGMLIRMMYGSTPCTYNVHYTYDKSQLFQIKSLTGTQITDYRADNYSFEGYLYVTGIANELPELILDVNDGVEYEQILNDDGDPVIRMTCGDDTYDYHIYYTYDMSELFRISNVQGTGIMEYSTEMYENYGYLYLKGCTEEFSELNLTVGEGVDWSLTTDEDDNQIILMNSGSAEYKYYVYYSNVREIQLNQSETVNVSKTHRYVYFKFEPETSGNYILKSSGNEDTYVTLFDAQGSIIDENDDSGNDVNFRISANLEANETYYYRVRLYNTEKSGSFTVTLTRDGSEVEENPETEAVVAEQDAFGKENSADETAESDTESSETEMTVDTETLTEVSDAPANEATEQSEAAADGEIAEPEQLETFEDGDDADPDQMEEADSTEAQIEEVSEYPGTAVIEEVSENPEIMETEKVSERAEDGKTEETSESTENKDTDNILEEDEISEAEEPDVSAETEAAVDAQMDADTDMNVIGLSISPMIDSIVDSPEIANVDGVIELNLDVDASQTEAQIQASPETGIVEGELGDIIMDLDDSDVILQ
jgi:hypothetical protein